MIEPFTVEGIDVPGEICNEALGQTGTLSLVRV
jgi:hypothetical protein